MIAASYHVQLGVSEDRSAYSVATNLAHLPMMPFALETPPHSQMVRHRPVASFQNIGGISRILHRLQHKTLLTMPS